MKRRALWGLALGGVSACTLVTDLDGFSGPSPGRDAAPEAAAHETAIEEDSGAQPDVVDRDAYLAPENDFRPTIALVQAGAVEGTAVVDLTQAFSHDNTAGNLIVAFVRTSFASTSVTLSDTAGNTYAEAVSQTQDSDGHQARIFYATKIKAGANAVKAAFGAANNHPWLAIYEYAGVSTLDQVGKAQGSTSTPSCATPTTTAANELVFAGLGMLNSTDVTVSAGAGYTLAQQDTGSARAATETLVSSSANTFSGAFVLTGPVNWSCVSATFRGDR